MTKKLHKTHGLKHLTQVIIFCLQFKKLRVIQRNTIKELLTECQ